MPRSARPTVLIADDNALMRTALSAILGEVWADEVLFATNGNDAVAIYRKRRPDIVFLDIRMPGKDGLAALQEIRQADPRAYVVMVSGYGSADNVKAAIEAGARGFIVKPYDMNRILAIMNKYESASRTDSGGAHST